jgi:hypothetical protein
MGRNRETAFMSVGKPGTAEDGAEVAAQMLCARVGLGIVTSIEPLCGGSNNRGYRVVAGGGAFFLKQYFRHPSDSRDRLQAEYAFASFAWSRGLRCLPEVIAADLERGFVLYEFVKGRRPETGDVKRETVDQALSFFAELNSHRYHPDAAALPEGSEACFSIADHMACVGRRVDNLREIEAVSAVTKRALAFVNEKMSPAWNALAEGIRVRAEVAGLDLRARVTAGERCLSPSDFGFHNAIFRAESELVIIDFEYAGWDDPAKMICDFFCQPQVSVGEEYLPGFIEQVENALSADEQLGHRVAMLFPVYRLKWCCIMLNPFLSEGAVRRRFSGEGGQLTDQIDKAEAAFRKPPLIMDLS